APPAGPRGRGLSHRHARARRRPDQHRDLLGWRGAGGARGHAALPQGTAPVRPEPRRVPGIAVPARRHGDRPGGRAPDGPACGLASRCGRAGRQHLLRDGQAIRDRRRLRGLQPGAAAPRRLRLPARLPPGAAPARRARAPDPRRNQRDHASHHRAPHAAGRRPRVRTMIEESQDGVRIAEIPTASGHRFGHATLDAPASLNALTLAMVDRLASQLDQWIEDPGIAGIVLDAVGDKAFCAGGDVVALYRSIRAASPGAVPAEAAAFFEREYRLDYRIHTCPKPVLCWGHGIVMGGGIGLLAGASHRVATPATRLAMPEISIGLYPDVGGSWFLGRAPGRTGLFLALTGAPMTAADARFVGLADFVVAHDDKAAVLETISASRWEGSRKAD